MKQVIVVDATLDLPPGKLAAQVAHAAVAAFLEAKAADRRAWLEDGMPKVVLRLPDEMTLDALAHVAEEQGIAAHVIRDAGRTVIAAGTATCIGIGPAADAAIDQITGAFKLLR